MIFRIEDNQKELYEEYHALLRVARAAKAFSRSDWDFGSLSSCEASDDYQVLCEALDEVEHLLG